MFNPLLLFTEPSLSLSQCSVGGQKAGIVRSPSRRPSFVFHLSLLPGRVSLRLVELRKLQDLMLHHGDSSSPEVTNSEDTTPAGTIPEETTLGETIPEETTPGYPNARKKEAEDRRFEDVVTLLMEEVIPIQGGPPFCVLRGPIEGLRTCCPGPFVVFVSLCCRTCSVTTT